MLARYAVGEAVIDSAIDLELPQAHPRSVPSLRVRRCAPPAGAIGAYLAEPGTAECWVTPSDIWVNSLGGVALAVQDFVQGLAIATALQQRGLFYVHASSFVVADAVVAVIGRSGSGKTSLAAAACRQGLALHGDDRLLLDTSGTQPLAIPVSESLQLPNENVSRLGLDPARFPPAVSGKKRLVPAAALGSSWDRRPLPLRAFYHLEDGVDRKPAWERVPAAAAVAALLAAEFRVDPAALTSDEQRCRFAGAVESAARVPMRRCVTGNNGARPSPDELLGALLVDLDAGRQ